MMSRSISLRGPWWTTDSDGGADGKNSGNDLDLDWRLKEKSRAEAFD